jgi:hypothetical protein
MVWYTDNRYFRGKLYLYVWGLAVASNNEGTTALPNIKKYMPSDTTSHPRRLLTSITVRTSHPVG